MGNREPALGRQSQTDIRNAFVNRRKKTNPTRVSTPQTIDSDMFNIPILLCSVLFTSARSTAVLSPTHAILLRAWIAAPRTSGSPSEQRATTACITLDRHRMPWGSRSHSRGRASSAATLRRLNTTKQNRFQPARSAAMTFTRKKQNRATPSVLSV